MGGPLSPRDRCVRNGGDQRSGSTPLATASPALNLEDANAEEDLALGGYRGHRLIIELAQNAADAAARAELPGRLRSTLRDQSEEGPVLVAARNTGAPLNAEQASSRSPRSAPRPSATTPLPRSAASASASPPSSPSPTTRSAIRRTRSAPASGRVPASRGRCPRGTSPPHRASALSSPAPRHRAVQRPGPVEGLGHARRLEQVLVAQLLDGAGDLLGRCPTLGRLLADNRDLALSSGWSIQW